MKTFYNFDDPIFVQDHIRIDYEFILGSQFLIFHLQNGLKHVASVSGFFFPMSSFEDFLKEMKRREIVTAFLNIHPTDYSSEFAVEAKESSAKLSLRDLSKPLVLAQLGKSIRQKVESSSQLFVEESSSSEFFSIYQRQEFYSKKLLDRSLNHSSSRVIWFKVEKSRKEKAVACFGLGENVVEYLLSTSSPAGRSLQTRLLVEAMAFFKEKGFDFLNLGGGIKPNDGLEKFKLRIGDIIRPKRELRIVLNRERFERFGGNADKTFFPSYYDIGESN